MTYKPGQKRGAAGTTLGGQFVGAKSIARALIKMMAPHEAETHDAGVKARTPKGGPAIGRLMARPSAASARMDGATHAAIAADHRASFGPAKVPHGDALAAARAHVADMQRKAGGTPSAPSAPEAPSAPSSNLTPHEVQVENKIRAAYRDAYQQQWGAEPGHYVGLAQLRDKLGESMPRAEVDAALKRMAVSAGGRRDHSVQIVPIANSRALSQADRDSALHMGGEDHHAIKIKDPSPLPAASAPSHAGVSSASKKLTASQLAGMSPEEVVQAHAEGRVTRAEAAKTLRRFADGAQMTASIKRSVGTPEENRKRESAPDVVAAQKLADDFRRMADAIEAAPVKKSAAAKMTKQLEPGDRVVWTDSVDGTQMHGTVSREGRLTYVDWEGGRRERVNARGADRSIRKVGDTAAPSTPTKAAAAAKMTRAKAPKPPVTPDMLRNAQSPGDVAPLLEGRTAADLRQIAGDAGIHVTSKATKDQLRQAILQHGVQARLNSHSVSGTGTVQTDNGGRISREEAARVMFGSQGAAAKLAKATPAKKATAAQKMTRGKAAAVSPAETVAKLQSAGTRDEARAALQGLSLAQLKAIAAETGSSTSGVSNKAGIIGRIVEHMVGFRLNSAAIRGGSWAD